MPKLSQEVKAKVAAVVRRLQLPRLDTMLTERQEIAAKLSQLETRKKKLDADILALTIKKAGERGTVETDEFKVTDTHGVNEYIPKANLIKLGVRASIIEKAIERKEYSYPRITRKKEQAGE